VALIETPKLNHSIIAPNFLLPATNGNTYSLNDVKGKNGLLVMFICNHCPYVKAILDKIIRDCNELKNHHIGIVAIMSNDPSDYPEDSFENMKIIASQKKFPFYYLLDETQDVARKYEAVCTPDFFGFNKDLQLMYRGRLDASKKDIVANSERELFNAMVEISKTNKGPELQYPSIGCSIKWK
jgi:peroxiredoxin